MRRLRQLGGATTVGFAYTPMTILTKNVDDRVMLEFGTVRPQYIGQEAAPVLDVVQATNAAAVQQTQALAATAPPATAGMSLTRAQQSTLNTGVGPTAAAVADVVAATTGYPVVQVPAMYAGNGRTFVNANLARSSIQDYFFQPTFVSQVLPVSRDAHAVAIAATLAEPALLH